MFFLELRYKRFMLVGSWDKQNWISLAPKIPLMVSIAFIYYVTCWYIEFFQVGLKKPLMVVPTEIALCVSLTSLTMRHADLKILPSEIGTLHPPSPSYSTSTKYIHVHILGDLRNMVTLDVSYNALTEIPTEVCRLEKLTTLNLNHNKIDALPYSMGYMVNFLNIFLVRGKILLRRLSVQSGRSQYRREPVEAVKRCRGQGPPAQPSLSELSSSGLQESGEERETQTSTKHRIYPHFPTRHQPGQCPLHPYKVSYFSLL